LLIFMVLINLVVL